MVYFFNSEATSNGHSIKLDDDENSPLLSGHHSGSHTDGSGEEKQQEHPKKIGRDFQTIRVPGSGAAVRK